MPDRYRFSFVLCFLALLTLAPVVPHAQTAPVYVTAPTPPPAPEDPCRSVRFRLCSVWSWLKCNPGVVSAIASCCSAGIALWIGVLAYNLNRNIRRGQIAHDQMKMLLEIDTELINRPELWAVHGNSYASEVNTARGIEQELQKFKEGSSEQKQVSAMAIAAALSNPDLVSMEELRKRAFVSRYFNFFDILYANYGSKKFGRDPEKSEEWKAWKAYIKDFLRNNNYAIAKWGKFRENKIYTPSFIAFIEGMLDELRKANNAAAQPETKPKS